MIQKCYWLVLPGLLAAFLFLHFASLPRWHGVTYNVQAIVFALLIVVLTMKVRIGNKWLVWCGMSLFPLYIYQRLPMSIIRTVAGDPWVCSNANLFIGVCFLLTVGITLLYNRFLKISFQSRKALS
jgi:peptidoglycan/LPS O-acetylase OafA/YrhL